MIEQTLQVQLAIVSMLQQPLLCLSSSFQGFLVLTLFHLLVESLLPSHFVEKSFGLFFSDQHFFMILPHFSQVLFDALFFLLDLRHPPLLHAFLLFLHFGNTPLHVAPLPLSSELLPLFLLLLQILDENLMLRPRQTFLTGIAKERTLFIFIMAVQQLVQQLPLLILLPAVLDMFLGLGYYQGIHQLFCIFRFASYQCQAFLELREYSVHNSFGGMLGLGLLSGVIGSQGLEVQTTHFLGSDKLILQHQQ